MEPCQVSPQFFSAQHRPVAPDVKPVRRMARDETCKRMRIRSRNEARPAGASALKNWTIALSGLLQVLDHIVANHKIEAIGGNSWILNIAANLGARVIIVL